MSENFFCVSQTKKKKEISSLKLFLRSLVYTSQGLVFTKCKNREGGVFLNIGIDKIGFFTPPVYVDMEKLAEARDTDPAKYTIGIGQDKMAVAPLSQDAVTMAANAALDILSEEDREQIDFVLFGTETGIDHSKSGAVYVHHLTGIQPYARSVELKHACYSATAAIQLAKGHLALNPTKKVLVLASDIARYGLNSSGEPTQGAGAIALLLSVNPRIMSLEAESVGLTRDVMDFWRPLYSNMAMVDGKYSNEMYIEFFLTVWERYSQQTNRTLDDFAAICFHLPYTKMGRKALKALEEKVGTEALARITANYESSIFYNREVGNIYTGSLYLSLLSLLENSTDVQEGDRIGLFSYGSGAVGEFFTGTLQPGYRKHLLADKHRAFLDSRRELTIAEYEALFSETLPTDGTTYEIENDKDSSPIILAGIKEHARQYQRREEKTN